MCDTRRGTGPRRRSRGERAALASRRTFAIEEAVEEANVERHVARGWCRQDSTEARHIQSRVTMVGIIVAHGAAEADRDCLQTRRRTRPSMRPTLGLAYHKPLCMSARWLYRYGIAKPVTLHAATGRCQDATGATPFSDASRFADCTNVGRL